MGKQLKELFQSLDANADGAVSKEELEKGLNKDKDEHGLMKDSSLGKLIADAGFNPYWNTLGELDTNKDGHVTWQEFETHLRSTAKEQVLEKGNVAAFEASAEEKAL